MNTVKRPGRRERSHELAGEFLRAQLRAIAEERELANQNNELVSAELAEVARLVVHSRGIRLAEAAREAGVARQSLYAAAQRAVATPSSRLVPLALTYLAAAGPVEAHALQTPLGIDGAAAIELSAELRRQGLVDELMTQYSPNDSVTFLQVSEAGLVMLDDYLSRLSRRTPRMTTSVAYEVDPDERRQLVDAAETVIAQRRFATYGPELTQLSQGVRGPEIAVVINTVDHEAAHTIAKDLWQELRNVSDLPAAPPIRVTVMFGTPDGRGRNTDLREEGPLASDYVRQGRR